MIIKKRNLIKMIVCEYPTCLDLEFCENFLETINDKIDLLKANFHPLIHFETPDSSLNSKF
jgi:hypothetical protein